MAIIAVIDTLYIVRNEIYVVVETEDFDVPLLEKKINDKGWGKNSFFSKGLHIDDAQIFILLQLISDILYCLLEHYFIQHAMVNHHHIYKTINVFTNKVNL